MSNFLVETGINADYLKRQLPDWPAEKNNFEKGDLLDKGTFGFVYSRFATQDGNRHPIAMKSIMVADDNEAQDV